MKTNEVLFAVYNDKQVLSKFNKSLDEYILSLRSLEQLKNDNKDIEKHVKDKFGITASVFKKIAKARMKTMNNTEEVIEELNIINEIANSNR